MVDQAGKDLMAIDSRLFTAKGSIDSLHQEIAEFFYPERASFTKEITLGEEFASHLTDFYPVLVRRELGDQISSMVRPSDSQWFKAKASNERISRASDAASFLEFMTDVNRSILYSRDSGYRRAAKDCEQDWAAFGMGWTQVAYTKKRDNLLFKTHHPKNMAGCEGPDGQVNHVHRKCDMKANAMAHLFGESKLPQPVKNALKEKNLKDSFKVRHIFIPLDIYEPYRKFPKGAKWADIYVTEDGTILQEIPAFTFDYIVPRWQTLDGHMYAVSPATIIALPQARMIQRMMMTIIEAGEKQVDPPMIATQDAVVSPIDLSSNGITYIDSEYDERLGAALRAVELGKNTGLGVDLVNDARARLADAFYINKLAPMASIQGQDVTAYQASQIVQEYIRHALPLFEPIEDEWTGRTLDLVTEKVMRAGGYGPVDRNGIPVDMPDILLGQNITYEFNNSLKEARDRQVIGAFQESAQLLQAAMALDPTLRTDVDTRTAFRDAFGSVPNGRSDWLIDAQQAEASRRQMQQAMAEQQQMQQLSQGAEVAGQVGNAAQQLQAATAG
ncbi:Bacteriophage head to tail connecting protein [Rhizobium mongolense subsp. loessense]|uniref:Bacteriophage head to tail connecting protein n=1 Tax=Rhizobium mongolense subsp. loessense TaxID=158890 RepID=A0A1G4Q3T2_9HYPH|nr:portal protein [Rhizobium mongolense]SCW39127.1 Bacteriophage head to tail connecting protein [Rhizobium mongolense subsp. loessense]